MRTNEGAQMSSCRGLVGRLTDCLQQNRGVFMYLSHECDQRKMVGIERRAEYGKREKVESVET